MSPEERLVVALATYEPVIDIRPPDTALIRCVGGCQRTVARDVKLCLHCRNTSNHPAFGRGLN